MLEHLVHSWEWGAHSTCCLHCIGPGDDPQSQMVLVVRKMHRNRDNNMATTGTLDRQDRGWDFV